MECGICTASNQNELEALGVAALKGDKSWAGAAREGGLKHGQALKHHMELHYVDAVERVVEGIREENDLLIADAVKDLQAQMAVAPADVAPLYAVAIHNLRGLQDTKPSQQALTNALKAIHEIQGMKTEQRMLLEFSKHYEPNAIDVTPEPRAIEA